MNDASTFEDAYSLIAELWCSPQDIDAERNEREMTAEGVVKKLGAVDEESAALLSRFVGQNDLAEEDYVDLFELDPKCALYLGSHTYDEPKTCATAGVSDRNGYMIELIGIYRHFGRMPNGKDLPDFLPLVVDFLALTAEVKNDPIRVKLVDEYVLPFLSPLRARLEELGTPYLDLLDALERVINVERKTH